MALTGPHPTPVQLAERAEAIARQYPPRTLGRRAAGALHTALRTTRSPDAARRALATIRDEPTRADAIELLDQLTGPAADRSADQRGPERIQRRRTRAWRKPPGAVIVTRPARWGNPYPVETYGRDEAIRLYREYLAAHPELVDAARAELAGASALACWCPLDSPCHADVLIELVNGEVTQPSATQPAATPKE